MEQLIIPQYYVTLSLVALHVAATILKVKRGTFILLLFAFISSLLSMVFIIHTSGHPPVSGNFEKLQCFVFYLLLIALLAQIFMSKEKGQLRFFSIPALIIIILPLFSEMKLSEHYIIYEKAEVVLFFQMRLISMALFAFSISCSLEALFLRLKDSESGYFIHLGRNFCLLGAAAFLSGEFFGSLWALDGWGDPWRWSNSFFTAGAMFLLSMLAGHIPAHYLKNNLMRIIFPAIPLVIIIVSYLT